MSNHFYTPSLYYLYFSKVRKREINRTLSSLSLFLSFSFFLSKKREDTARVFNVTWISIRHWLPVNTSRNVSIFIFILPFILISAQWFIDFCQGWRLKKAWKEWEESMEKGSVLHNRIYEKFGRNMKYNSGIFYF